MTQVNKYRQKAIIEAFYYQGQYPSSCPEWSRAYVTAKQNLLPKDCYVIRGQNKQIFALPREAFEATYEVVREEFVPQYSMMDNVSKMCPEGIEDPTLIA